MPQTEALYYPFHLCHELTLEQLLTMFARLHFRDYMALQLSQFSGTTAYADRMGGFFPELTASGRLVQGYNVSGPLSPANSAAVDRDLSDATWRGLFHHALVQDRRFQRGLFDVSHTMAIGGEHVPGPAALLHLMDKTYQAHPYRVAEVSQLSQQRLLGEQAYMFEYGLALLKTSAALVYTASLATAHRLAVATDSQSHFALLNHMVERDGFVLSNHYVVRSGY